MKYSGLLGRAITPPSPYYLKSVRMDTEFDWCAWAEVSGAYGEEITVQIEPGEYNVLADLVGKEVVLTARARRSATGWSCPRTASRTARSSRRSRSSGATSSGTCGRPTSFRVRSPGASIADVRGAASDEA
jgi:hypothetical protein